MWPIRAVVFGLIALSCPCILWSGEPAMQIIVDHSSMLFVNVSDSVLKSIVETNELGDPDKWSHYGDLNLPFYDPPKRIKDFGKAHPEYEINDLDKYGVVFDKRSNKDKEQRVLFFYLKDKNVLLVAYIERGN
jgi:hypothetical protein